MTTIKRRDFLKITAVAAAGVAGTYAFGRQFLSSGITLEESRELMGTLIHLKVVSPSQTEGEAAIEATFAEMERLITFFDYRNSSTELGKLNSQGNLANASKEMIEVLQAALQVSELTDGAFDISVGPLLTAHQHAAAINQSLLEKVSYKHIEISGNEIKLTHPGMSITLDGIAKGYIVDKGVAVLQDLGFANIIVEAGGDLMANGQSQREESWKIGIAHPRPETMAGYLASFSLADAAAATSGDYMNAFNEDKSLHHILDPKSGYSPTQLASVTTIADSAMMADALSTAFMVCGVEKSLALAKQLEGVEALFVTKDLEIVRSSGFPS